MFAQLLAQAGHTVPDALPIGAASGNRRPQ